MLAIFEAQIDYIAALMFKFWQTLPLTRPEGKVFQACKIVGHSQRASKRFEIAIAINIERNFEPSCKSTKTQSIDVSLLVLQRGWNTLIPKFTSISILGSEVRIVDVVEFV